MKVKEYIEKVDTLQKGITDCNNLIEMYQDKREVLKAQLKELLEKEL